MSILFSVVLILLVGYLLGCLNGAVLVSHFVIRDDVRRHGSGNAGLTNFYRTYGARYALMVIGIDMGKMVIAGLIGGYFFHSMFDDRILGLLIAGLGCELGHMFPVFFGFKGGKGILSGSILVILLDWRVALVAWAIFFILWAVSRYVSLGSVCCVLSAPVTTYFFLGHSWLYTILVAAVVVLILYSHRSNVIRLVNGTESKFHWHVNPTWEDDVPQNQDK